MSDEFNASSTSLNSSPSWFSKTTTPNSPGTNNNKDASNNDSGVSKFMKKFGRKTTHVKDRDTGNLQQQWSRRNQMNLSMGVSTRQLDR
mmetsp:Transcript_28740/g.69569  ORF Transcript_28740/g.69569 Transcript_28740/m.69569 type:complete len:89 (-) Transcript_28740:131-397(-)